MTQQRVGYSRSVSEKSSHRPLDASLDRQQVSITSSSSITSSRDDTQDSESQLRIRHWLDDNESGSASVVLKVWGSVSSTQPARTAAAADTVTNQPSPCAVSFQWHGVEPCLEEFELLTGVGAWLRLENTGS